MAAPKTNPTKTVRENLATVRSLCWLLIREVNAYRDLAEATATVGQYALAGVEEPLEHRKRRALLYLNANEVSAERQRFAFEELARRGDAPSFDVVASMLDDLKKSEGHAEQETAPAPKAGDLCPKHGVPLVDLGHGELGHEVIQREVEDEEDDEEDDEQYDDADEYE